MNMTDEDRALLGVLARLNDVCGTFGLGVMENNLSQEDQIEMALLFVDMAECVLKRLADNPVVIEGDGT